MGNFYQPQQQQNPLAGILQALLSGSGGGFAPQSAPQGAAPQQPQQAGVPNAQQLAGMQALTAQQPGANAYSFAQTGQGGPTSVLNPFGWITQQGAGGGAPMGSPAATPAAQPAQGAAPGPFSQLNAIGQAAGMGGPMMPGFGFMNPQTIGSVMGNPGQVMANQPAPEQRAAQLGGLMDGGPLASTFQLGGMIGGNPIGKPKSPFGNGGIR